MTYWGLQGSGLGVVHRIDRALLSAGQMPNTTSNTSIPPAVSGSESETTVTSEAIILIAIGGCIAILLIVGLMMIRGSSKDPYYYGDESDRPGAVVAFENPQYADGGFNQGGDEPGDGLYDEPDMAQDAGYLDTNEQGDDGDEGDGGFDGSDAEDSEDSE